MTYRSLVLASALCLTAGAADAEDKLFLSGAEIGGENSSYGFASVILPLPGNTLGDGFVQRYWVEGLTYSYEKGSTDIDATAGAVEGAIGYQGSSANAWWGAYAGVQLRRTHLDPNDPDNDIEGNHVGLKLQLEGEQTIADTWKFNGNVSYTAGPNAYWSRFRVTRRAHGDIFVGPEFVYQGDADYNAWQLGAIALGIKASENTELGFKLGARKNEGQSETAYAGVELVRVF